jgi:hypothetical protein
MLRVTDRVTDIGAETDTRLDGENSADDAGLLEEATPEAVLDLPMLEETRDLDTAELRELLGLREGRDEPTELGREWEIETGATKISNDDKESTCRRRTTRDCRFARGNGRSRSRYNDARFPSGRTRGAG